MTLLIQLIRTLLKDNIPKKSVLYVTYINHKVSRYERSVRSDRYCHCYVLTTIFYRNQKFWFQIISCHSFFSVFVRDRRLTIYTIFRTHQFHSTPRVVKLKRAPDLAEFIKYSLLSPLCSASVFKFCLHDPIPARLYLSNLVLQTFTVSSNWVTLTQ